MRSIEDRGRYNNGGKHEIFSNKATNFEFHKGNGANRSSHRRTALAKPTPSKWDDAQKWVAGLSKGGDKKNQLKIKTKPRNSNADDLSLIAPVPQKEQNYYSSVEEQDGEEHAENGCPGSYEVKTKNVECEEPVWRINKPTEQNPTTIVRSICVRDMGTEMTPIASQEPSRTATPIRATTPAVQSPISSGSSTPIRYQNGKQGNETYQTGLVSINGRREANTEVINNVNEEQKLDQNGKMNPLEMRAMAWDEAERAKYVARYKQEEVKIQAWENHENRKAEMEMRKMEVKAERMKARAQEKLASKLAAIKRVAEEKHATAEAKMDTNSMRTSEKADHMKRTGHLPSSFSFRLPSMCCKHL